MKKILLQSKPLFLIVIFAFLSCNKEEAVPLTGELKITIRTSDIAMKVSYELYTEGSLAAGLGISVTPLASGEVNSNIPFSIKDLNPGNYSLRSYGRFNTVQVTAGRVREYEF